MRAANRSGVLQSYHWYRRRVEVNGRNIRDEVLRFNTLPVENTDDTDHFLSPADARKHIEDEKLTAEDLIKIIPTTANNDEEKKAMKAAREKDKGKDFNSTKVRTTAKCVSCGALRAIYSNHKVGVNNGPTETELVNLERSIETDGYCCGDKLKKTGGKLFYSRRAIRCGQPIEAAYYNPTTGTKGGRIVTDDICSVCYVDADLATPDEIRSKCDLGGKTPLMMCRGCLNLGVDPPCSGARKNVKQAKQQQDAAKKRRMEAAVSKGRRKARRGA